MILASLAIAVSAEAKPWVVPTARSEYFLSYKVSTKLASGIQPIVGKLELWEADGHLRCQFFWGNSAERGDWSTDMLFDGKSSVAVTGNGRTGLYFPGFVSLPLAMRFPFNFACYRPFAPPLLAVPPSPTSRKPANCAVFTSLDIHGRPLWSDGVIHRVGKEIDFVAEGSWFDPSRTYLYSNYRPLGTMRIPAWIRMAERHMRPQGETDPTSADRILIFELQKASLQAPKDRPATLEAMVPNGAFVTCPSSGGLGFQFNRGLGGLEAHRKRVLEQQAAYGAGAGLTARRAAGRP